MFAATCTPEAQAAVIRMAVAQDALVIVDATAAASPTAIFATFQFSACRDANVDPHHVQGLFAGIHDVERVESIENTAIFVLGLRQ
jgi:hypothetical protein